MAITDKAGTLMDIREFVKNPEPRCPCTLLVDTSLSMVKNGYLDALNDQIPLLRDRLEKDYLASLRVEISVVAFGDNVEVVHEFSTMDNFYPSSLKVDGFTSRVGQGIRTTLDLTQSRKHEYWSAGVAHYTPWVLMITDCEPTGEPEEYLDSVLEVVNREIEDERISFWIVGTPGSNTKYFERIIQGDSLITLKRPVFGELFDRLSSSMSLVSRSGTGAVIRLDADGLRA